MLVSIVAAVSLNGVIGKDNKLPWRLPEDLKRFRALTMGKPVIMGRKTLESLGGPLRGRTNIVLTHDTSRTFPGCVTAWSLEAAVRMAADVGGEAMVIGGASVYSQALPIASSMYLTVIEATFDGDAFFPKFDLTGWKESLIEVVPKGPGNDHAFCIFRLDHEAGVVAARSPQDMSPAAMIRSIKMRTSSLCA